MRARTRFVGLVVADAVVLVACRPDFAALARDVRAPHDWIARAGTDDALAALAGAAVWVAAVWLALGLVALLASALPGWAGRAAAAVSGALVPAVIRRIVVGSAGLSVLVAPVAAQAAHGAQAHHGTGVVATSPTPSLPAPTLPTGSSRPSLPAPTLPTTQPAQPTGTPDGTPTGSPTPSQHTPRALPAPAWPMTGPSSTPHTTPHGTATNADQVRVRTGDSLWLLAARRLGPGATPAQIADAWPHWYAANRAVIGADPNHLVPGEVLHVPTEHTSDHPEAP